MTEDRNATRLIALSFAVSGLASLGLLITYIVGGQPQVEGSLIAVSLGGLAVGLILWAHHLMPSGHFVEEREPHRSTAVERSSLAAGLDRGGEDIHRRTFLGRILVGGLGILGVAARCFRFGRWGPSRGEPSSRPAGPLGRAW